MNARKKALAVGGIPLATLVGVLACFGDDAVGASINPALASIAAAFPEMPYSQILWLYTLPKIVIVPITLASGFVVGGKVSFRAAAITGFALIALGGMAPFFLDDFWAILGFRFVMGVGLGIQAPIGPALVMRLFDRKEQRAFVLGAGHGVINAYGVATNLLVGVLCAIEWRLAFLAYGTVAVLLVLAAAFLKNPEKGAVQGAWAALDEGRAGRRAAASSDANANMGEKGAGAGEDEATLAGWRACWRMMRRLDRRVFTLCLVYLATLCVWGVAGLNLSAIIQANGFGNAAVAGTVLSLINLSGMASGFAFGFISRACGRYTLALGYAVMACGLGVYALAPNLAVLCVGVFVAGAANTILITGFENEVGSRCGADLVSLGMALCMVVSQLSGFLSGFYISFVMDVLGFSSFSAPVGLSALVMLALGCCFSVWAWAGNARRSEKRLS